MGGEAVSYCYGLELLAACLLACLLLLLLLATVKNDT